MNSKSILTALALAAIVAISATNAQAFMGLFGKYQSVEADNGVVTLPAADLADGKAHYFSYDAAGREVRFFVIKSSDDVLRAAFDACDVCWREGKGYSQDGDIMVCNNCGQGFHTARINEVKGGCNPAPLNRTVNGDNLVITRADLLSGAGYFF